ARPGAGPKARPRAKPKARPGRCWRSSTPAESRYQTPYARTSPRTCNEITYPFRPSSRPSTCGNVTQAVQVDQLQLPTAPTSTNSTPGSAAPPPPTRSKNCSTNTDYRPNGKYGNA